MPNRIDQIIAISTKRYNETRATQLALAQAYQAITNYAREEQGGRNDPKALVHFLRRPHSDANLSKACMDVFRLLGTSPMSM